MLDGTWEFEKVPSYDTAQCIRISGWSWILAAKLLGWVSQIDRVTRFNAANEIFIDISICSTSLSGGNQVDGLPPASSLGTIYRRYLFQKKKNLMWRCAETSGCQEINNFQC